MREKNRKARVVEKCLEETKRGVNCPEKYNKQTCQLNEQWLWGT